MDLGEGIIRNICVPCHEDFKLGVGLSLRYRMFRIFENSKHLNPHHVQLSYKSILWGMLEEEQRDMAE